ncbi:MAG: permease, partial [Muribaculaceae bacterium]|nr:permease [Muribaculaceae bacterium]
MNIIEIFWAMLCEMAPYLLLGFGIAGVMHAFVPASLYRTHLTPNTFGSVVKAALFGIPLPLCSCGVVPTAMGLQREGASRGATVSF